MKELSKGLDISIQGPVADQALGRFRAQAEAWGVALPAVEPLVLDFGLGDFKRWGLIEFWIANEAEAGYCGKYLFVFDGQTCPEHHHRGKMETFFVVQGRVRIRFDGRDIELAPGAVLAVPPGKPHAFTGVGPVLLLELSQPCVIDDNYFADRRIPIGGNYDPDANED